MMTRRGDTASGKWHRDTQKRTPRTTEQQGPTTPEQRDAGPHGGAIKTGQCDRQHNSELELMEGVRNEGGDKWETANRAPKNRSNKLLV